MSLNLTVSLTETSTHIMLPANAGELTIQSDASNALTIATNCIYLITNKQKLVRIGFANQAVILKAGSFESVITINMQPWEFDAQYLERALINTYLATGLTFDHDQTQSLEIPSPFVTLTETLKAQVLLILNRFGLNFKAKSTKAKPAKAQHRWSKAVSEMPFTVNFRNCKATIIWQKRNEMCLKKGATMLPEAPLNKDGSVGFAAKMGEKIRSEHAQQFKNFITTEDIILKSVNEVSLFLYFGGTNSWLEFLDAGGKTIDSWTVVGKK